MTVGLRIQAWGRGSQCSNVYQNNKLGDSINQQNVIQLSFEEQAQAQLVALSNLQKLGTVKSNYQHNEILADVAWVLNRLLDNFVTTIQYANENLTPENRKILNQYLARHEKFFLNLMGGDKEGLIQLIKTRLHFLQIEWQSHSNSLPTIGFIQTESNSASSARALPTIGFIQPEEASISKEKSKSKPLPTIGFIQDSQNKQAKESHKLPTIGFIQPSPTKTKENVTARRQPTGFIQTGEKRKNESNKEDHNLEVSYRFELTINEKLGIFDVAKPDSTIGFISGN